VSLSLVVVVDGVDDVLLAVFDDLPDGATDHVTGWDRGDAQAFALAFEQDSLKNKHQWLNTNSHAKK